LNLDIQSTKVPANYDVERTMPLVSIIVPNYNHALFLKQRIDSILDQTFQNFELIILDDCSTDGSLEIIDHYRNHQKVSHVIVNDKNTGSPFKQWRKGLSLAKGEYSWIAESDDWAEPEFLEILIDKICKEKNIGICFCSSFWVDAEGRQGNDLSIYKEDFFRSGGEEIRSSLVKFCTIQNASSALIKTALAQKYINRITHYKACGDWHLYIDVLGDSNLLFVGRKLNYFRWYQNNVSNMADKSGRWITEGLKVLAFSDACKIKYSSLELADISRYWYSKTEQFRSFKKLLLQVRTGIYLWLFRRRNFITRSN
jgi:glycosyltransferase involved in cell wall biosynthesis